MSARCKSVSRNRIPRVAVSRLFTGRQQRTQSLGRRLQLRECRLARLVLEAADQPGDRERASELAREIEERDGHSRHLRIALTERNVMAAVLHRFCLWPPSVGECDEHMRTGTGGQRQFSPFIEMVACRVRRVVPK